MNHMSLTEKIVALLENAGLKQSDLADYLNVERSSVSTWISGKHEPSSRNLKKIAALFGVKITWFRIETAEYPPEEKYRDDGSLLNAIMEGELKPSRFPSTILKNIFRILGLNSAGTQAIEMIDDNLFRVNDPSLMSVFRMIEESLRNERDGAVTDYCERIKSILLEIPESGSEE